jgi:hypothetical protein
MNLELTKEIEEEIFEALYDKLGGYKVADHIHFYEVDKVGTQTYEATGKITLKGVTYHFTIRDGDSQGSEVLEFVEDLWIDK